METNECLNCKTDVSLFDTHFCEHDCPILCFKCENAVCKGNLL